MTQKELLYIEDALNHCLFLKQTFTNATSSLKNDDLKKEASKFEEWATEIYNSIYELLN